MSVCLSVFIGVRFFSLIDFKIDKQLPFGTLKTKQIFFALNPSHPLHLPKKGNFQGISITPQPFHGITSNFQISCLISIHSFWKKSQPQLPPKLSNHLKYEFLHFQLLTSPRWLKISRFHFDIPFLHRRF